MGHLSGLETCKASHPPTTPQGVGLGAMWGAGGGGDRARLDHTCPSGSDSEQSWRRQVLGFSFHIPCCATVRCCPALRPSRRPSPAGPCRCLSRGHSHGLKMQWLGCKSGVPSETRLGPKLLTAQQPVSMRCSALFTVRVPSEMHGMCRQPRGWHARPPQTQNLGMEYHDLPAMGNTSKCL